jgi:hypothetical protein
VGLGEPGLDSDLPVGIAPSRELVGVADDGRLLVVDRYYVASTQLMALALPAREVGREWEREDPFEELQQKLPM